MMYEMKDQFEDIMSEIHQHKLRSEAFETLGLGPGANPDQIRLAYKKLALKYHPDKHKNSSSAREKFHKINESYICLVQSEENSDIADEMMCQFSTLFRFRVKTDSGYVYFMSNPNADEADQENRNSNNHRGVEIKKKLKKKQELNEFRGKDNLEVTESPNEFEIKELKAKADKVAEELINEEDNAKKKAMKKREKKLRQREKKRQEKGISDQQNGINLQNVEVHNGVKYEDQYKNDNSDDEITETVKLKTKTKSENTDEEKSITKNLDGQNANGEKSKKSKPKNGKLINGLHKEKNEETVNENKNSKSKNNGNVKINKVEELKPTESEEASKKSNPENGNENSKKSSELILKKIKETSVKEKKKQNLNMPTTSSTSKIKNNQSSSKQQKTKGKNKKQKVLKSKTKSSSDSEEPGWDENSAFFSKVASSSKITKVKPAVNDHNTDINHIQQIDSEKQQNEDTIKSKKFAMEGNRLASNEQYGLAVEQFTRAILLYNKDYRYFGNRSFCFDRLEMYSRALEDANTAISLNFSWPKGYFRRGRALTGLGRLLEAEESFKKVLKLDNKSIDAEKEMKLVQIKYLLDMGFSKALCEIALKKNNKMSEALDFLLSGAISESNLQDVYVSDEEDAKFFENELLGEEKFEDKVEIKNENKVKKEEPDSESDEEFKEIEYKSLWIGDLANDVTEKQLIDYFNQFGMVKSVNAMYARKCGFVNFYSTESAKNALLGGDNIQIMNRNLIIRYPDRAFETNTVTAFNKSTTLLKNEQPIKSNRRECFYWRNRGCKFGEECYNAHLPENAGIDIRPSIARHSLYD